MVTVKSNSSLSMVLTCYSALWRLEITAAILLLHELCCLGAGVKEMTFLPGTSLLKIYLFYGPNHIITNIIPIHLVRSLWI